MMKFQHVLLVASLSNLEREDLPQEPIRNNFKTVAAPYSVILIREELRAVTWDLDKVRRRVKRYRHWNAEVRLALSVTGVHCPLY